MTSAILLLALLGSAPQTNSPAQHAPLRNSFAAAAESVIDQAEAVEIHAGDDRFKPQMQLAQATYSRLKQLAEDAREEEVARALNDLLFAIAACHITAAGGDPTASCEAQVHRARMRSMEALDKHKTSAGWADGPPPD